MHRQRDAEENARVVRAYVDAFNRGDSDALRRLFTPDAIVYGLLGAGGLDVVIPIWRELHAAFAVELQVDGLVAQRDTVVTRYTERGMSVAPFRGHGPTGRSYEIVAMEWFAMQDGLIHRRWAARDAAAMARQLGLPPP
jgi:predicted ester cyclase